MLLQKHISTTRGTLIIIAAAFFALGAIFGYEYYLTRHVPVYIDIEIDSHGCLVNLGYSWCGEKNKCLTEKEECKAASVK